MRNSKIIKIFILFLFLASHLSSQVTINDNLFLAALIEYGVDTNQDGQIQFTEASALTKLEIEFKDFSSIGGIEAFVNLTRLKIGHTLIDSADLTNNLQLTSINLSDNELKEIQLPILPQLEELLLRNNDLTKVDLNALSKLEALDLRDNNILSLDLSGLPNLLEIDVTKNNLDVLDFSQNPKLKDIDLSANNVKNIDLKHLKDLTGISVAKCPIKILDVAGLENLFTLWVTDSSIETIFMKGTAPENTQLQFDGAPLKYICADKSYFPRINKELEHENITDCLVTSFCPYTDEGVFGGMSGKVKIAQSISGCETTTNYLAYSKIYTRLLDINGQHTGVLIGTKEGSYAVNYYGTMTLKPALTYAPEWQHIVPEFTASNYSSNPQNITQDFCMIPVSNLIETQLHIIPLEEFRVGSESKLILQVRNTGTQAFSGTLKLKLPKDSLTYISANYDPSLIEPGSISWEVQDLLPFEEINIKTTLRLNSSMDTPPLNGNESIRLCAELTDGNQYQNQTCVEDYSVNSFDVNDKTYLGKDTISIDEIQAIDRLIYLIRFENTGTAEAENIVLSDTLDPMFLLPTSIRIVDASHPVNLEMGEDGVANFIFSNIDLPFEVGLNRAYVLFSVESRKENISVNDKIDNNAAIYFDFNRPILTEEASIWIIDNLVVNINVENPEENSIKIFPNPSAGNVTIESASIQNRIEKIEWIDRSGKVLRMDKVNAQNFSFNATDFSPGIYSLRITTAKFVQVEKVILQGN